MRLAIVGASPTDVPTLEAAVSLALETLRADEVVYLGDDDAIQQVNFAPTAAAHAWIERVADLAIEGTAEQIAAFSKLEPPHMPLRRLPPAPAHAMELLDDQLVLLVRDLEALDDEDRENASVIVHRGAAVPAVGRAGRAYTLAPGELRRGKGGVGLLLAEGGGFVAEVYEPGGTRLFSEKLDLRAGPTLKVVGTAG